MTTETLDLVHVAWPGCLTENRVPAARLAESPRCGKCGAEGKPAARYGTRGIPTLILFEGSCETERVSGATDKGSLLRWIARYVWGDAQ